jgi:N-acetylglucosamine malate deacetylase 1
MVDEVRLLVIGAHPDDCEITAGGLSALTADRGGRVLHVALTNGDKGHQTLGGATLARIRREEARAAAAALGAEALVLDNHDGELMPTLERRNEVIRIIRDFRPDLVLFPRPYDYHPDHRNTSHLVQDALYMVRVQNVCAHSDRLDADPVAMYVSDTFQRPYPFQPDVIVDVGSVYDKKIEAVGCHACQMFEWLPFVKWDIDVADVPKDHPGRMSFLRRQWDERFREDAVRFQAALVARYGTERASQVTYAETFEVCELGAPLTPAASERFFPF